MQQNNLRQREPIEMALIAYECDTKEGRFNLLGLLLYSCVMSVYFKYRNEHTR